jgi:hypothetical protein
MIARAMRTARAVSYSGCRLTQVQRKPKGATREGRAFVRFQDKLLARLAAEQTERNKRSP